ncbi:MarR family transcriptional regulator [Pyxidicoccus parkwayensis]|uniref:MarR family transcriptional regulator n=1 Tax=Pyxidicoccus parkwayensis TaxID=2813578 RepID=A0ABX7NMU2_9BACT|nr:MarR family transcriptional regulator [Pyxidicoccus parkwaysis]QSQ18799.1 MarR family transcriptional regulator [Pyxidicoccus parkwaysis]
MERIEDCINFLAGKAYQQLNQEAKRRLAEFGVTPPQYAVLKVLWQQDGQSGAAIGERLVLDSATVTGLIDRLSGAGLIERRADPEDRRVNRLYLTRSGRALQAPLDREMDEMNEKVFARLGLRDAQKLRELLAKLGQER